MKILRYLIFLSIFSGIFFVIYRQSDEKGFRRWWISFKIAVLIAASAAGLIPANTEAMEPPGNNNQVYQERLLSDQEFNSLEEDDQQIILAKNYGGLPEVEGFQFTPIQKPGQNQKLDVNAEYRALIGSGQDKVILAAFRGKFLVNFDVNLEEKTDRLNANFRIFQRNPDEPSENLDLTASIPEDRVLAKLYQIPDFGVNVPREVDLKRARNLPTRARLEYLRDKTSVETIQEAYIQFANHLKNEKTEIFLGKFGEVFFLVVV